MSHFIVLVIGEDVEKQLAPYQENNMGDCPQKFLTWVSVANDYENIQEAIDDGYKVQNGIPGYWENLNRKWDWYEIGGRWTGFFTLKDGSTTDQALKRDIDFEGMQTAAGVEAMDTYRKVSRLFGGSVPKIQYLWKTIIDDNNEQFKNMSIDAKRDFYNAQEALQTLKALQKSSIFSKKEYESLYFLDPEDFQIDEAAYVQNAKNWAITAFAVVKDGKWYEKGEMGWWACVTNEKEPTTWETEFNNLLNSVSDDTLLTIVDCHI